jgi:hypothetical protein
MRNTILSFSVLLVSTQLLAGGEFEIDLKANNNMLYMSKDQRFVDLSQQYATSLCEEKKGRFVGYSTELASTQPKGTQVAVPDYGNLFPFRNSIQLYPLTAYENGKFKISDNYAHSMSYDLNQPEDSIMVRITCENE